MSASKEAARQARTNLEEAACLADRLANPEGLPPAGREEQLRELKRRLVAVDGFLEAAERKLPTAESYAREKARRREKVSRSPLTPPTGQPQRPD